MNLTLTMGDPVGTIMRELTDPEYRGVTQASVAITYAFCIAQLGENAPWSEINAAIKARWKGAGALKTVKDLAWRQIEYWKSAVPR